METFSAILSQKLGEETLWHTNLQKVQPGECEGKWVSQPSGSELEDANWEFLYVREKEDNTELSQSISNSPTMLWLLFISVKVNI